MTYLIAQIWVGLLLAALLGVLVGRWLAVVSQTNRWSNQDRSLPTAPPPSRDPAASESHLAQAQLRAVEAAARTAEAEATTVEAEARAAVAEMDAGDAQEQAERFKERARDAEERAQAWEDKATAEAAAHAEVRDLLGVRQGEFARLDARLQQALRLQEEVSSRSLRAVTLGDVEAREALAAAGAESRAAAEEARAALDEVERLKARVQDAERRAQAWEDQAAAEAAAHAEADARLAAREAKFTSLDKRLQQALRLQDELSSQSLRAVTAEDLEAQETAPPIHGELDGAE